MKEPYDTSSGHDDDDDDIIKDYEKHEGQQKLRAPENWDGPVHVRRCTDIGCLLLFLVALFIYACVGFYALSEKGDPRVIVYPMDYDGNICGMEFRGKDMTDYPYLYYVNTYAGGVCVEECPQAGLDMHTLITYNGIWQTENATLPWDVVKVANYSTAENVMTCTQDDCYPNESIQDSWSSKGIDRGLGYAYYVGDTYELLHRCYLTSDTEVEIAEITGSLTEDASDIIKPWESHAFWTNFYGDLWTARNVILGFGFGVSLFFSLIYVSLLRIPCLLNGLIWTSIISVIGIFAVGGYYTYTKAEEWAEFNPFASVRTDQVKYTQIMSYVLFGLSALCVLFACCFRSSIGIAVRCVQESGRAINQMVLIFGVPFMLGILMVLFWLSFVLISATLASLGDVATRSIEMDLDGTQVTMRVFEFNDFIRYCGWYLLFVFFWVSSFVLSVGDMTVALAVSRWYFTVSKREANSTWVLGALGTTLRYHLGTLAFGSLLVAIVRLLRAVLLRVQHAIKSVTNEKYANMLLCCCQCCLCCLERILKFINKNAYIQCAIFGTPFIQSGRESFYLIVRQAARVGSVVYVNWAIFFMGKVLISAVTTASAYYALAEYESELLNEGLYSYGGPIALIFCISFFMSTMFMGVFDTSILTILHCFAADEEMFQDGSKYTDKEFRKWVDEQQEKKH